LSHVACSTQGRGHRQKVRLGLKTIGEIWDLNMSAALGGTRQTRTGVDEASMGN